MILKAIQTPTIQEAVYEELYQAIVSGKISPGERITMRKLAKDLEVSVMPVREALRRLEARSFITIQSNRQILVNELSPEHFRQIFKARLLLEGHSAKSASKRRSELSLKALEASLKQMKEIQDDAMIMEANRQFHTTIYQEANLPVFLEIIDSLWERVSPYFYIIRKDEAYWIERAYLKNHEGMLEGMQQKKPHIVYKWLKNDLSEAADVIYSMIAKERKTQKD